MSSDKTVLFPHQDQDEASKFDWGLAQARAKHLFKPSSPIDEERLFSGRLSQVHDLLGVIYESGAHAILYGERGVGKSSLANTVTNKIPPQVENIKIFKQNCRPEDSFFDLWSKMLWDQHYEDAPIADILKYEDRPFVVNKMLEALPRPYQYVFIFDEFDRIQSPATKSAMADTIKHFSDYPQRVTIIIIGVGFSIEELFGAHPSIQRCCQQILMPRMDKSELGEIISERYQEIGLNISDVIISRLVDLAQGLPGFVHLLGREAALSAIDRKSRLIEDCDYIHAVTESVRKAQESLISSYNKAVYSAKENLYQEVLLACAMAETDERGKFSASNVKDKLSVLLNRPVEISYFARHLSSFCDEERGPVLRKTGKPKAFQYQFIEAPLQPYILMMGKKDGLI